MLALANLARMFRFPQSIRVGAERLRLALLRLMESRGAHGEFKFSQLSNALYTATREQPRTAAAMQPYPPYWTSALHENEQEPFISVFYWRSSSAAAEHQNKRTDCATGAAALNSPPSTFPWFQLVTANKSLMANGTDRFIKKFTADSSTDASRLCLCY